jgi:hypothetical protein
MLVGHEKCDFLIYQVKNPKAPAAARILDGAF